MPHFDNRLIDGVLRSARKKSTAAGIAAAALSVCTLAFLGAGLSAASAASLSRSVDVNGTPEAVWSMIGPFCAIKDWLPPVGSCTEDGKTPPTRILVTKDGNDQADIFVHEVGRTCPADFDNDGFVGVSDLQSLIGCWGSCLECGADLDADGGIGITDLLALLGQWATCR